MKIMPSSLSVLSTSVLFASSLVACAPIAQLVTAKPSTSRATVRFSSPSGNVAGLDLSSFNPDRIEGMGQSIPAYLGQTGLTYTTSLQLSLGSGTKQSRSISVQVSEKLTTGYTCAFGLFPTGTGALNICNLTYNSSQQNLTAGSGTFSVSSFDGQKLRFTAQATLNTASGGTVNLDVDGQIDDFKP